MTDGIPPMEPLAPIIDQMRLLAVDELPTPQTCRVTLWDDGTFDAYIYHAMGSESRQQITYDRATSEIVWEHMEAARYETTEFPDGKTLYEPLLDGVQTCVLATVEPPYK